MRPTRITASICPLNSQQGAPAAVQAPRPVAARRSSIDLRYRTPGEDFRLWRDDASISLPSISLPSMSLPVAAMTIAPAATSSRYVSCQRDVEKTPSRWGASTIHKVMKPASCRREDRGFAGGGVEATRSVAITLQQPRRIGGS